jgi:hypothetical protein
LRFTRSELWAKYRHFFEERRMLKIRLARPEDAALLNQMGNASYRHHFAHLWHNADEMERYLQQEYSMAALAHSLPIRSAAG